MPTRTGSAALQNTVRAELSTLLPLPQPAALLCSPYSLCGPLYVPLYVPLFVPLFCCSCNSPYHPTTLPASALAAGLKRGSAEKPLRRFSAGVRTTHLRRLPASLPPCLSIALPPPAGPSYGPISSSCPICLSAPSALSLILPKSPIGQSAAVRLPPSFLGKYVDRPLGRRTQSGWPQSDATAGPPWPALLQHCSSTPRLHTGSAHPKLTPTRHVSPSLCHHLLTHRFIHRLTRYRTALPSLPSQHSRRASSPLAMPPVMPRDTGPAAPSCTFLFHRGPAVPREPLDRLG